MSRSKIFPLKYTYLVVQIIVFHPQILRYQGLLKGKEKLKHKLVKYSEHGFELNLSYFYWRILPTFPYAGSGTKMYRFRFVNPKYMNSL